jgi:hypothetical protein
MGRPSRITMVVYPGPMDFGSLFETPTAVEAETNEYQSKGKSIHHRRGRSKIIGKN